MRELVVKTSYITSYFVLGHVLRIIPALNVSSSELDKDPYERYLQTRAHTGEGMGE
jgi:hypothetical protein